MFRKSHFHVKLVFSNLFKVVLEENLLCEGEADLPVEEVHLQILHQLCKIINIIQKEFPLLPFQLPPPPPQRKQPAYGSYTVLIMLKH
jgi:hypothetical protein